MALRSGEREKEPMSDETTRKLTLYRDDSTVQVVFEKRQAFLLDGSEYGLGDSANHEC